ncbi:carboxypeptidase regulatory-like domain-containing protein [Longimicrobium terrae]|uniref:Pimeloyl-ACP methyl ester carboxylesterase n=1 Tax=Longimicrobium terrae TaxID=1639882 RepID=A0A841H7C6_9BACT|nr:carboxypeptidase regulatory-like domain-containing protein [Longimicrobium terrae]MBB4639471.1 pimeloyl-ACP methyl ester carboxylesterase [Longimicrobium terrae]MBB6073843.1 pimeloyl-ACP methyl ester carboxylesterase [Longimicrobium terrae]NNC32520.1 hypothetical protein [Longimicrobium terrae]
MRQSMLREGGTRGLRRGWRAAAMIAAALLIAGCDDGPVSPRGPSQVSFSGTVRTQEGRPVPDVSVHLAGSGAAPADVITDAEGRFSYTGLKPGDYRMRLLPPFGYEATPAERTVELKADVTLDVSLRAVRDSTVTIAAGTRDTVGVASGTYVMVDASALATPVRVGLAEAPGTGFGELSVLGTPVVITAGTADAPAPSGSRARFAVAGSGPLVPVTVWQRVPTCTGSSVQLAFRVDPEAGSDPVFIYAQSECTTWTDPTTGRSGSAVRGTASVPAGSRLPLAAFYRDAECTAGDTRRLTLAPGSTEGGGRIPLIVIHGWQPDRLDCASFNRFHPETETFGDFITQVNSTPDLASRYSVYVLRYPTFQPVGVASEYLHQQIEARGWRTGGVVLVGHSMGGLVGRGYLAGHGGDAVRALITLGTPHEGSPLADVRSMPSRCGSGLARLGDRFATTPGMADLSPGGPFITSLRGHTEHGTRVLTLAGDASIGVLPPGLTLSRCMLTGLLEELGVADRRTDAVVPVASAIPAWTGVQHLMTGEDHNDLTAGTAATRVRFMLRQVARCVPGTPPAPVAANAFPLSGSVARQDSGRIDVVLNPIVIDGKPVAGLTKDNFTIVENDCLKFFDITTSEGNVGVDVVFIQDLSGSMSGAITGVRNSVLAFAADLRDRGLNVRLGSVGFSGGGTIVTHPGMGTCERLGPALDLAAPNAFLDHVRASWTATGGCDGPENGLEAIKYAHERMSWRPGAARVYIVITDISMHHAGDTCNGAGRCTDQTIRSIVDLVGSTSTIQVVAPTAASTRTSGGGVDPWLLADGTGGSKLVLPANGSVNLLTLGIAERIAQTVRLTFTSTTDLRAAHRPRIRVTVGGAVAEIAPGLISYDIDPSLARAPR